MLLQEDWRINHRLTLNLGLRYELSLRGSNATTKWAPST